MSFNSHPQSCQNQEELARSNWPAEAVPEKMCSPKTVRKALVVFTGMVKSEQVYWPSSDRLTSLILMVSSSREKWTSSILLSLRAAEWRRTQKTTESVRKTQGGTSDRSLVTSID